MTASHCEAIKYAYRQSKEGTIVSFVLHPNEVPKALHDAAIGSRWMLALVEIGDDEKPKEVMQHQPGPLSELDKTPPGVAADTPRRAVKVAPEKRLVQQSGILTGDPLFQVFLNVRHTTQRQNFTDPTEAAAYAIREYCGVTSRSEIIPGSPAAAKWEKLTAEFECWKRE
jgi:hypothetical protein